MANLVEPTSAVASEFGPERIADDDGDLVAHFFRRAGGNEDIGWVAIAAGGIGGGGFRLGEREAHLLALLRGGVGAPVAILPEQRRLRRGGRGGGLLLGCLPCWARAAVDTPMAAARMMVVPSERCICPPLHVNHVRPHLSHGLVSEFDNVKAIGCRATALRLIDGGARYAPFTCVVNDSPQARGPFPQPGDGGGEGASTSR